MYPTVDINMRLWDYLRCERIDVADETAKVQQLLDRITLEDLFRRATWLQLRGIGLIQPNEDILPVRTRFTGGPRRRRRVRDTRLPADTTTMALAYLRGENEDDSLWYSIPDLVLSKILTGRAPKLKLALTFHPSDRLQIGLTPVRLYGSIPVNPSAQDFFEVAMEQRQAQKRSIKENGHGTCGCEPIVGHTEPCRCSECHAMCVCFKCGLTNSLKVTGNSGSFGIFAEFNQEPNDSRQHRKDDKPPKVKVYGVRDEPVTVDCDKVDVPGPFSFPPIATLITGGARLMLGMLEKCVTDAGGSYCMESPESWFEDFGFGEFVNGLAQIQLDPEFAAVVNSDAYHVFITEYDDNNALYVAQRTSTGFEVRTKALTASGTFSYRVVAKRKDITPPRLEKVTIPRREETTTPRREKATILTEKLQAVKSKARAEARNAQLPGSTGRATGKAEATDTYGSLSAQRMSPPDR